MGYIAMILLGALGIIGWIKASAARRRHTRSSPPSWSFCRGRINPVLSRQPVSIRPEEVIKRARVLPFPPAKQRRLVQNAREERFDRVRQLFADIGITTIRIGENRGSLYHQRDFCGRLEFGLRDEVTIAIFDFDAYLHVRAAVTTAGFSEVTLIERKLALELRQRPQCGRLPSPDPKR